MSQDTESCARTNKTNTAMKLVNHLPPPQEPSKKEKTQKLGDLEPRDCFRFFDGTSFEDAKKTAGQSFFFVTGPNGAKPGEEKVPCLTFDMRAFRQLDADRLVIKHEIKAALLPATPVDIPPYEFIEDESETA